MIAPYLRARGWYIYTVPRLHLQEDLSYNIEVSLHFLLLLIFFLYGT